MAEYVGALDQGQTCFDQGEAKNTYGTGCLLLLNTGHLPVPSCHGFGAQGNIPPAVEKGCGSNF